MIHSIHEKDIRHYNTQTANEIATISYVEEDAQPRDIVLKMHDNKLKTISELHSTYDPLQYLLLFLFDKYSWYNDILRANIQEIEEEVQ